MERSVFPILVLMATLVAGGCAGLRSDPEPGDVLAGGPLAQSLALHPHLAASYTRGTLTKDFESFGVFNNYYILQPGPYLSKDERATLADLVGQALRNPNVPKKCQFAPRHGVRVGDEGDSRGVLICFSCNTLVVCDRKWRWSADMGDQGEPIRGLLVPLLGDSSFKPPVTR